MRSFANDVFQIRMKVAWPDLNIRSPKPGIAFLWSLSNINTSRRLPSGMTAAAITLRTSDSLSSLGMASPVLRNAYGTEFSTHWCIAMQNQQERRIARNTLWTKGLPVSAVLL